jgi:fructokinase
VNGELVEGAHAIAGEWGHVPLPWPRADELDVPACWCGQRGCLETWISGTGLQRDYLGRSGCTLSSEAIIEHARGDDAQARDALRDYIDRLGRALAMVCNIVDPDTIVLGGGLSNVAELYAQLPAIVRSRVFSDTWSGRIVPARWGDSSGVRGAARLWKP